MTEKLAKAIVRKYGKGKDHLTSQDCSKVLNRRYAKMNPTKRGNTPKKGRVSATGGRKWSYCQELSVDITFQIFPVKPLSEIRLISL